MYKNSQSEVRRQLEVALGSDPVTLKMQLGGENIEKIREQSLAEPCGWKSLTILRIEISHCER